jgi:protein-disulfide isomerase
MAPPVLARRTALVLAPSLLAAPALAQGPAATPAPTPGPATDPVPDPRTAERGIGRPDAPVRVIEFFSLTCSHCAAFHKEVFPRVKAELITTGQARMVWRDFPLDRLALVASAVARSLPAERYEGFIGALLNNQDRWAFTRGDPKEELAKMAALAGMNRATYDTVFADEALQRAILEGRARAEQEFQVQATPSFNFASLAKGPGPGRNQSGNMPFETFATLVQEVSRA